MDDCAERSDHEPAVRTGLLAAGLVLFAAVVLLTSGGRARSATVKHTCSVTDKQFIAKTELDMTSLGSWGEDYRAGEATEAEVIAEARKAAKRVGSLSPSDPSLQKTKLLVAGMFTEYGRAMWAKAKKKDAAPHMYRAYGLANFAHDVLTDAKPELLRRGCDVSSLL
jgi:hypothetical protein